MAIVFLVVLLALVLTVAVACFWLFENAAYHDTSAPVHDLHLRGKTDYAQE